MHFFRDRRRLQLRLRRQKLLGLELVPGPWFLVEVDTGRIVGAGKPVEGLFGVPKRALLRRNIDELATRGGGDDWSVKELSLKLLKRPGHYEDVRVKTTDRGDVVVEMRISHAGTMAGRRIALCLMTDRTDQHRLQSELIGKHKELRRAFTRLEEQSRELAVAQDSLKAQNAQLAEMTQKLSRASELAAIGEITAELTHQLNNPLAAAVGAARRLEKLFAPSTNDESSRMTELLKSSLERMRTTISELRRVYKTSRPSDVPATKFDLREQIDASLTLLSQRLENCVVEVRIDEPLPQVIGRPENIQHVIINLIDNALHAVDPGGSIHIEAAARGKNKLALSIADSGPGVPENLHARIFEPFFTTRAQGSGLGLAVVRRHLDQDGALITVDRSHLGGARFEITFQAATL